MKTLRASIFVGALVLLLVHSAGAQQNASIADLKEQIQRLEAVGNDPTTPPDIKALNDNFLQERRTQLSFLLAKRINSLRSYQSNVGSSLTAQEIKLVEGSIKSLEKDLQELKGKIPGNSPVLIVKNSPITSIAYNSANPLLSTDALPNPDEEKAKPVVVDRTAKIIGNPSRNSAPTSAPAAPQVDCYPGAPALLTGDIHRVAEDIVDNPTEVSTRLNSYFNRLLTYTILDAVTVADNTNDLRKLEAYRYIGETARTDKQIGASATASGSTSAVEKPGFAEILGFAIEHGSIDKNVDGTSLTLSTSPYTLFVGPSRDTARNYRDYDLLNRIGISATFDIEDENSVLASARRKQLSEYSVKIRLLGDRSTRSDDFLKNWERLVKPAIVRRLLAINIPEDVILNEDGVLEVRTAVKDALTTRIVNYLAGTDPRATKVSKVEQMILCALGTSVFAEIQKGNTSSIQISQEIRNQIIGDFVPGLSEAQVSTKTAREAFDDLIAEMNRKPLGTLAYTNVRTATGSDYSIFKLLFEHYTSPAIKMVANIGGSLYHKPDRTLNQSDFRDFFAALSFEGKTDGPFATAEDQSQITFALTGRYQRLRENKGVEGRKADMAIVQFKLDIPLYKGFSFPFSVTYANATQLIKEKQVRANFGFTLDTDKLYALTRSLLTK
jgi:hypothetical protein